MRQIAFALSLATTMTLIEACSQSAPPSLEVESSTEGGGETASADAETGEPQDPELSSYFPLVDGGHWEYVARTSTGQVIGTESVDATAIDFNGEPAFLFEDNPNAMGEWTRSTIVRQDGAARRVHKELVTSAGPYTLVDYAPGFTRIDDAWSEVGVIGELTYERTETDGSGANAVVETRGHSFEVTATGVSVTVPAGTFDCVEVERTRTTGLSAGELVRFWYAPGIGKVKEYRPADNRVEELTAVDIPGGAVYP